MLNNELTQIDTKRRTCGKIAGRGTPDNLPMSYSPFSSTKCISWISVASLVNSACWNGSSHTSGGLINCVPFVLKLVLQVTQEKGPNAKAKAKARAAEEDDDPTESNFSTGVWPPEIGVHRVVWNDRNGLGCVPLLASGTGSGLCRVDWLPGRWFRDKVPYVNVPNMRKEVEVDEDVDSVEE